jgi:hypothetical protein
MYKFDSTRQDIANLMNVSIETVKRWEKISKIPPHCYVKLGYKTVRYCPDLIRDWMVNSQDPVAWARSIEALQNSLPSNQSQKRGRKAAA